MAATPSPAGGVSGSALVDALRRAADAQARVAQAASQAAAESNRPGGPERPAEPPAPSPNGGKTP